MPVLVRSSSPSAGVDASCSTSPRKSSAGATTASSSRLVAALSSILVNPLQLIKTASSSSADKLPLLPSVSPSLSSFSSEDESFTGPPPAPRLVRPKTPSGAGHARKPSDFDPTTVSTLDFFPLPSLTGAGNQPRLLYGRPHTPASMSSETAAAPGLLGWRTWTHGKAINVAFAVLFWGSVLVYVCAVAGVGGVEDAPAESSGLDA